MQSSYNYIEIRRCEIKMYDNYQEEDQYNNIMKRESIKTRARF